MSDGAKYESPQERWVAAIESANLAMMREAARSLFAERAEFRRPTGENGQARFFGYDEWAPWIEAIVTAFHPLRPEMLDRFDNGKGRVCQLSLIRGTHSNTFALPGIRPVPATGLPISFEELTISQEVDNLIAWQWAYFDLHAILKQIKAL